MTTRVLPAPRCTTPILAFGRNYIGVLGTPQDVPDQDAAVLGAAGWLILGLVGTTAQRPLNPLTTPAQPFLNQDYYDTTIAVWITWDGANWRNMITGAAV
jgi:hypothetical protein